MSLDETVESLRSRVEAAFADRSGVATPDCKYGIEGTLAALDRGELRVASPPANEGEPWVTNAWVKQAILLYFAIRKMETTHLDPFEYADKVPLKKDFEAAGVRVVPPAVARYGSFLGPGVSLIP